MLFTRYYQGDQMKGHGMGWEGAVAHMGEMRNAYKILVRRPESKDHTWHLDWTCV
jgi:hypothetical protein